jgi:hypothetical protein
MRLAILLSGQARKFEQCSSLLKEAVSAYEADYYIHTWNTSGPVLVESAKNRFVGDVIPDDLANRILLTYNPKGFCIESPISFTEYGLAHNHGNPSVTYQSEQSFWSSLYSRKKVLELVHEKYDAYMWIRTDIALYDKIPNILDDGVFYTAHMNGDEWNRTHFNTVFAITANKKYLSEYLSTYDKISRLYESGVQFCDHRMTMASILETDAKYCQIMKNSWGLLRNV